MPFFKSKRNLVILGVLVLLVLAISLVLIAKLTKKSNDQMVSSVPTPTPSSSVSKTNSYDPPLKLKSIGINLDSFDPKTGKAGDFLFTKSKLQFDRLFMGYGFVIPESSAGQEKANPQPTFILPLGTKVTSLVDGTVVAMPTLWSGDYSVQVSATGKLDKWVYETEHVINPVVKVGDRVKAGQVVAEVSDFDKGSPKGFGAVEIGLLKGGNPPTHFCPFAYLDPTVKEDTFAKIKAFYQDWEIYKANTSLYGEEEVPGCQTLEPIDG